MPLRGLRRFLRIESFPWESRSRQQRHSYGHHIYTVLINNRLQKRKMRTQTEVMTTIRRKQKIEAVVLTEMVEEKEIYEWHIEIGVLNLFTCFT